jgi:hypothetical protein
LLSFIALVAIAGWYEPLVYESFEGKRDNPTNSAANMTARTCVYFSGHTLVHHRIEGQWLWKCPRRRGGFGQFERPLVDD